MTDEVQNLVVAHAPRKLGINIQEVTQVAAYFADGLYRIKLPPPLFQIVGINYELTDEQLHRICDSEGYVFAGIEELFPPEDLLVPKRFLSYQFTKPQRYIPPVVPTESAQTQEAIES